jgi:hypothetical protein
MDEGPTTVAQFCYVAFKSCHPALDAAFGAQRHITTGATLRIRLSPASSSLRARQVGTAVRQGKEAECLVEILVRILAVSGARLSATSY